MHNIAGDIRPSKSAKGFLVPKGSAMTVDWDAFRREAAKECAIREGYLAGLHHEIMKRVFKAGAEWMAERDKEKIEQAFFSGRMKKKLEKMAMAGEVNNTGYPTTIQLHTFDSSLKNGDKVNIIIIKHEQD